MKNKPKTPIMRFTADHINNSLKLFYWLSSSPKTRFQSMIDYNNSKLLDLSLNNNWHIKERDCHYLLAGGEGPNLKRVFAIIGKQPKAHFAKTRLGEQVGHALACELYESFLYDFLYGLKEWTGRPKVYFFYTPADEHTKIYFQKLFQEISLEAFLIPQEDVSFFNRLGSLTNKIYQLEGQCEIFLTGTDIPDFPFSEIEKLSRNQLSIGPDRDGGFYFMSYRSNLTNLFHQIENRLASGEGVYESAHLALKKYGHVKVLAEWSDIDFIEDLFYTLKRSNLKFTNKKLSEFKITANSVCHH